MKAEIDEPNAGSRVATLAAVLLSACVVVVQSIWMFQAGPLWRDEAGAVSIAAVGSLSDIFPSLLFDSFPIGHYLAMRAWIVVFSAADTSLRAFGFVVAILALGIVWMAARSMRIRGPLIALSLYLLHPIAIRYSSSIRAYGLAMLLCLLTWVTVWKATRDGGGRAWVLAAGSALLAVHLSYQNWFFLAAICIASAIVSVRSGSNGRAVGVLALGAGCAITVVPYLSILERAGAWNELARVGLSPALLATHWLRFLEVPGTPHVLAWLAVTGVVIWKGAAAWRRGPAEGADREVVYASLTFVLATLAFGSFLLLLGFLVNPWYFIPWVAIASVSAEPALQSAFPGRKQVVLALCAILLVLSAAPAVRSNFSMKYTGVVAIAGIIEERAGEQDLVIVYPWEAGITFARYYEGDTEWCTMPPITDHKWHRYDQYADVLRQEGELERFIARLDRVFDAGGRIWLVTKMQFESEMGSMKGIPREDQRWRVQVRRHLTERARRVEGPFKPAGSVLEYEDPWVEVWEAESLVEAEASSDRAVGPAE